MNLPDYAFLCARHTGCCYEVVTAGVSRGSSIWRPISLEGREIQGSAPSSPSRIRRENELDIQLWVDGFGFSMSSEMRNRVRTNPNVQAHSARGRIDAGRSTKATWRIS